MTSRSALPLKRCILCHYGPFVAMSLMQSVYRQGQTRLPMINVNLCCFGRLRGGCFGPSNFLHASSRFLLHLGLFERLLLRHCGHLWVQLLPPSQSTYFYVIFDAFVIIHWHLVIFAWSYPVQVMKSRIPVIVLVTIRSLLIHFCYLTFSRSSLSTFWSPVLTHWAKRFNSERSFTAL